MKMMRGARYRLTSEILCAGSEGLLYLNSDTVVEVSDTDCVPMVEVFHYKGKGKVFQEDLLDRSIPEMEIQGKTIAA